MATVIAFAKHGGKTRDRMEGQGPATILMFTGVRVERLDDESLNTRSPSRRRISNSSQAAAEELEA